MSLEARTILVLGGGVGGVVTAVRLRRRLPQPHRIVLVEREIRHVFAPSLVWLMTGKRQPEQISRSFDGLRRRGIEVLCGDIEHIDASERSVVAGGRRLQGDWLVVALGAELAPNAVPGLAEAGHDLYSLSGALELRAALRPFRSGRLVVLTAAPAYKCPAAPYEAAMLLECDLRKRRVRRETRVDFHAAEARPMAVAGADVSAAVQQLLHAKDIAYHPEHQVAAVDGAARRLEFADGTTADFDLLAYVPPHVAPRVVRESDLAGAGGWVDVDRHTLATRYENVFAIGDVTDIPLRLGKPLPKAGVFAHAQGEVVAHNIAHAITGAGTPARFDGEGECFIETGDGKAGFGRGDFYAEPVPRVTLHAPGRRWHAGKLLFEWNWLRKWF